ncbi:MAG TPA: hypothetical protein VKB07_04790 [Gaiellaceae bacterium]|nr:hypothetical protein [Gaiellaceae bacterium]
MRASFVVSLPERLIRSLVGGVAGLVHESAQVLLPRFVRRSRLYEASAKNLLRISIELVGGVEPASSPDEPQAPAAKQLAIRKGAGNVVELGSIAAFGFSPLWLLAAASDVAHGSRVYLESLTNELKAAGVVGEQAQFGSLDDLLGALEGSSGTAARLIDIPPVELEELRKSVNELRDHAGDIPSPDELAKLYSGLRVEASLEGRSLLEVSQGIGLAFLLSAGKVSRDHLLVPYREDWTPIGDEGFAAYAQRVSAPYARAVQGHFDRERETWTERGIEKVSGLLRRGA